MPAKKTSANPSPRARSRPFSIGTVLLSLTLVPLVAGVLMIAAWALDIALFEPLDSQLWIGILCILVSFTLSNLLQKRWGLFAGWLLLSTADVLLLKFVDLPVQVIAIVLGVLGVILLAVASFRLTKTQPHERNH
jgi:hypothetical protein